MVLDQEFRYLTCNNPPDSEEALHAGDVHAATAVPWPSSEALQTERAWPGAGEQPTSEESGPAALVDMQLLKCEKTKFRGAEIREESSCVSKLKAEITNQTVGGAASRDHEEDR